MLAATDRLAFAPPPTPGLLRSLALAVVAHLFLVAALTWGVQWKRESATLAVEAELWSALPQEAAPALLEAPPEAPQQSPPPPPQATPALPEPPQVDIALEQEKLRLKKQQELERQRLQQEKLLLEKRQLREKQEKERKATEEKKKLEQERQHRQAALAQQEAQKLEAMRKDNMNRINALAGASGAQDARGTAPKSSGPSGSYAGRVSARIKPNIVFTEEINGNPVAEVEVRAAPNGTILSRKLSKSSGNRSWDEAVLKAIDKTEKLPPDTDGRVPQDLTIGFRPKD